MRPLNLAKGIGVWRNGAMKHDGMSSTARLHKQAVKLCVAVVVTWGKMTTARRGVEESNQARKLIATSSWQAVGHQFLPAAGLRAPEATSCGYQY